MPIRGQDGEINVVVCFCGLIKFLRLSPHPNCADPPIILKTRQVQRPVFGFDGDVRIIGQWADRSDNRPVMVEDGIFQVGISDRRFDCCSLVILPGVEVMLVGQ